MSETELQDSQVAEMQPQAPPPNGEEPPRRGRGRRRKLEQTPIPQDDDTISSGEVAPRRGRRSTNPSRIVAADAKGFEAQIAALLFVGGTATAVAFPVTGTVIAQRAEESAHALVEAAKVNPRIAGVIVRAMTVSVYAPLTMLAVTLATAIMVDVHIVPPRSMMAEKLLGEVALLAEREEDIPEYQPEVVQ